MMDLFFKFNKRFKLVIEILPKIIKLIFIYNFLYQKSIGIQIKKNYDNYVTSYKNI
jgi:hypothetical protein